jgi:yecA family protein
MLPQYQAVEDALQTAGATAGAAEVHGTLCGMLSANLGAGVEGWIRELFPEEQPGELPTGEPRQLLGQLFDETRTQLSDALLSFELLLPGDDDDLDGRVSALGHWCQGFLYGLAVAGVTDPGKLPQDSAEFIKDLSEIAGTGFDVEEDEENEEAYQEIQEYIRMGVLLVSEELQPLKGPSRIQ